MQINNDTEEFLRGKRISNGHFFFVPKSEVISRDALLLKLVYEKNALHLGCADHPDLIDSKRLSGRYLHENLKKYASKLVGVDINQDALKKMAKIGINDLYTPDFIPDLNFDMVLAPDVIEHVPNVYEFLVGLRRYNAPEIVITTPNALRLRNRSLFRGELINTDHRYWFTPYTLAKVCVEAGYEINAMWYTDKLRLLQPIKSASKLQFPVCRDGLAICINPA